MGDEATAGAAKPDRAVALVLRVLGGLDVLALVAVVMPRAWMAAAAELAGVGPLPAEPLVGYLARSASAVYVLHGLTVLFVSFDVPRYRPLIRLLAWVAVAHGAVVLAVDLAEGMPAWWTAVEGPTFSATGVLVLALLRRRPAAVELEPFPQSPRIS